MDSGFDISLLENTPFEVLAVTPVLPAPDGHTTNFIDHPTRAPSVLIITGVTVPLIVIFLAFRIYVRVRINQKFTIDDHLCVLSVVSIPLLTKTYLYNKIASFVEGWRSAHPFQLLSMTYTGLTLAMLDIPGNGAAGPHMWDVPLIRITKSYLRETLATYCLFAIASITVKTSILAFFLKLFKHSRIARIMSWIGIVAVVLFYTSYIVPSLPLCVPNLCTGLSCTKYIGVMSNAHGVFSTVVDFYILFIPIYMIRDLQVSPRRKYSLIGVFLTGLGACFASTAGALFRFKLSRSSDKSWASIPVYATVILELNMGIICACMPIVFVVFKRGTQTVKNHCSAGFRTLAGGFGKSDGEDFNLPDRPRAAIIGVRTVVHQVHYQNATEGNRWTNTYDSLESVDNDHHISPINDFRQYDVSITAG